MLVTCYERFEASSKDLCDIDKMFIVEFHQLEILMARVAEAQREADLAMGALGRTRNTCRKLATSFDEVEDDLNQGLHNIHQLVASTRPRQPCPVVRGTAMKMNIKTWISL